MTGKPMDGSRERMLMTLCESLERAMGPTGWWPAETPFEVCIGAILTQNAPWTGVRRAIDNLREAGLLDPRALAGADTAHVAPLIRPSIYHNRKAGRLVAFCGFLVEKWGGDIVGMKALGRDEARRVLLSLPGIGQETADSMLLYAVGLPVFVVDAYTKRILSRHGIAEDSWDYERLRRFFEDALEPDVGLYREFHALICMTGAVYCKRTPRCDACPAREVLGEPLTV